jgi:hypothetical protein
MAWGLAMLAAAISSVRLGSLYIGVLLFVGPWKDRDTRADAKRGGF